MPTLTDLEIQTTGEQEAVAAAVRREFPGLEIRTTTTKAEPPPGLSTDGRWIVVPANVWHGLRFDPTTLDEAVRALAHLPSVGLRVTDGARRPGELAPIAVQVVTRCQRLLDQRNPHSATPFFDQILAFHESLHDRAKPLVAADLDHARDTWRWVLRLDRDASLAVQIAALFHDVERLVSEAERRVEQHASDYAAFKNAHAAAGARMTGEALVKLGADGDLVERVVDLVSTHERPEEDPEKLLLNEADALSFFSLNACGFISYYGRAHTEKKVAYTLARLRARGLAKLPGIRHRADVAAILYRTSAQVRAAIPRPTSVATARALGGAR